MFTLVKPRVKNLGAPAAGCPAQDGQTFIFFDPMGPAAFGRGAGLDGADLAEMHMAVLPGSQETTIEA